MDAILTGFNSVAESYDAVWTSSAVGIAQRRAVWRRIDPLFLRDQRVLDLGCGTGVDAHHLQLNGVEVYGIDSSEAMVERAQNRGVNAYHSSIEDLQRFDQMFDGAISNFGALNCVRSLDETALDLARCVHSDAYVALCLMGRICVWEVLHFLARGEFRKAFRRFNKTATSSIGIAVSYPSKTIINAAFNPYFRLIEVVGIGLLIPPSYVTALSTLTVTILAAIDHRIAHWPLLRSFADHRLYIFQRL
jgi:ubiquinone/menaquinone biosynthesis C-methylase UbiE